MSVGHVIENRRRALGELTTRRRRTIADALSNPQRQRGHGHRAPWEIGQGPKADAMATEGRRPRARHSHRRLRAGAVRRPEAQVIGAAHAGWKGALAGVIDAAVEAMEQLGAKRARIAAAIGPCIGQANYEVGPEFVARFVPADAGDRRGSSRQRARRSISASICRPMSSQRLRRGRAWTRSNGLGRCTYAREARLLQLTAAPPIAASRITAGSFRLIVLMAEQLSLDALVTLPARSPRHQIVTQKGARMSRQRQRGMKLLAGNSNRAAGRGDRPAI